VGIAGHEEQNKKKGWLVSCLGKTRFSPEEEKWKGGRILVDGGFRKLNYKSKV